MSQQRISPGTCGSVTSQDILSFYDLQPDQGTRKDSLQGNHLCVPLHKEPLRGKKQGAGGTGAEQSPHTPTNAPFGMAGGGKLPSPAFTPARRGPGPPSRPGGSPARRAAASPLCRGLGGSGRPAGPPRRRQPDCAHARAGLASSPTSEPPRLWRSFIKRKHKPEAEGSTFKLLAALPVYEL